MSININQAVIFAGGLGERLKPFTETSPKPMYPIKGKPFLEYLICQIKEWDIDNIVILLGYLPEKIMDYFGDGKGLGVKISYIVTPVGYDTQNRLKAAKDLLEDTFLMMYCDNICPINYQQLMEDYEKNSALIQFSAYSNKDDYTKNNLTIAENGRIIVYDKKRTMKGLKGVDIGYAIASKKVLSYMSDENENFEAVVYPKLVAEKRIFATITDHRYYSIGSYERIALTKQYLSGRKYIFLDRDGTLNVRPSKAEYICKPEDFIWLEGAKEAIGKLNAANYFVILISNQAGIGRGVMTVQDFEAVQEKIKRDLSEIGAKIDATYYCPHGWDEDCECRKPKPGMLYQAQKEHSINLTKCVMIGDDERDIITAHNAGMQGILVDEKYTLLNAVDDFLTGEF